MTEDFEKKKTPNVMLTQVQNVNIQMNVNETLLVVALEFYVYI
jgi:hypothetical protein